MDERSRFISRENLDKFSKADLERLKELQAAADRKKAAEAQVSSHASTRQKFSGKPSSESQPITPSIRSKEINKHPRHPPLSKKAWAFIAGAAGLCVVTGLYGGNVGDVQSVFKPASNAGEITNDVITTPLKASDERSLAPDKCTDPDAALLTLRVSGDLPLAPQLVDAKHPTPVTWPKYMTEDNKNKLPSDQQDQFEKFITNDYTHTTLNDDPLSVFVCEPTKGLIESDGDLTIIHRSALRVSVEDSLTLFKTPLNIVPQVDSKDATIIPNTGEYMTRPTGLHLQTGPDKKGVDDPAFDKSVADLEASMQTKDQLQVMYYLMESQAVQQLDDPIKIAPNVSYPDSSDKILTNALDKALIYRMYGDNPPKYKIIDNYVTTVVKPLNAAKRPITENDPTTGASALIGFDPTQTFHITNVKVSNGAMKAPAYTPPPTPTPTPTPSPTPTK